MHKCQSFSHNQGIYLNEYMQVAKHKLFHDEGSCPIETSQLICSGNQYTGFCIIGTSVMKDWRRSSSTYTESLFLHAVKHNLFVCFFFFYLTFLSGIFKIHTTAGEREGYLLISFLPLPTTLQTLRHQMGYWCR